MKSCETLHPTVAALLGPLSELIGGLSLRQRIPQVEAVVADNATVLVLRALDEPTDADRLALREFGIRHGLRVLLQRAGPADLEALAGEPDAPLWYDIEDMALRLGFAPTAVLFSADYFPKMYELAERLVREGKAYVDDLTDDQIKEYRGTLSEPGKPSPYRQRSSASSM